MAEYINREALIAEYDRVHIGVAGGARKLMVEAPSADVVEVVRCKDCIYHNVPPCPMRLSLNWTNDNDFCSYGERRLDNG